jgi:hypothetical protein
MGKCDTCDMLLDVMPMQKTKRSWACAAILLAGGTVLCPALEAAAPPQPDFIVESIALSPAGTTDGRPITATVTVKNQGTAAGDGRYLDIWYNRTNAMPPQVGEVGDWWTSVGSLQPGASRTIIAPPHVVRSGTNHLCAFIEFEDQISETINSNNLASLDYSVGRGNCELDFNGDAKSDPAVFKPATATWALWFSSSSQQVYRYGSASKLPVPADYDGDGRADFALYEKATGNWYILYSAGGSQIVQFGWGKTVPLPGDYDGDGKADLVIFNPDSARWYLNCTRAGGFSMPFGGKTMIPVPADYDGDGAVDIAMYNSANGYWYILESSTGRQISRQYGWAGTVPAQGDYDGDGRADIAILSRSSSKWCMLFSGGGGRIVQFGNQTMTPVQADYDGDGLTDIAMYDRANGKWHIQDSTTGQTRQIPWGGSDAAPILQTATIHAWYKLP